MKFYLNRKHINGKDMQGLIKTKNKMRVVRGEVGWERKGDTGTDRERGSVREGQRERQRLGEKEREGEEMNGQSEGRERVYSCYIK